MGELWRELGGYQAMVDAGVDMVVAEATIRHMAPLRFDDDMEVVARITRLGVHLHDDPACEIEDGGEPAAEGELSTFHRDRRRQHLADPRFDPGRVARYVIE